MFVQKNYGTVKRPDASNVLQGAFYRLRTLRSLYHDWDTKTRITELDSILALMTTGLRPSTTPIQGISFRCLFCSVLLRFEQNGYAAGNRETCTKCQVVYAIDWTTLEVQVAQNQELGKKQDDDDDEELDMSAD